MDACFMTGSMPTIAEWERDVMIGRARMDWAMIIAEGVFMYKLIYCRG